MADSEGMDAPPFAAAGCALFLMVGGGLLTPIDRWYADLNKPRWNPPGWVFGPAWGVILSLWGYAGLIAWRNAVGDDQHTAVLVLFGINAVCHFLWSPLFFKFRRPDYALIEVVFLWGSLLALLVFLRPISVTASWLILPYFIWVSFAACLNATIVKLNRPFS